MGNIRKGGFFTLLPLIVFLGTYILGTLLADNAADMPIVVAGLFASMVAIVMTRRTPLTERIGVYTKGATDMNIMWMIWIFILAGAFSNSTKAMGAVDATVALIMSAIPADFLPAGIFIAACLIALSIGTSVGTIATLTPIAASIAEQTGCSLGWMVAIVIGGALFGDNLSFISDTTIAATSTQGCNMRDKFRTNFIIVAPAALATLLIYIFSNNWDFDTSAVVTSAATWYIILPYILVLVAAFCGVNVLSVLVIGILSSGIIGIASCQISLIGWFSAMGEGISSMGELIVITMIAGGMLEMIRYNGGFDYIISAITSRTKSRRGAEFSIAGLVTFADICTANNTVAIISVGPIVRDIAQRFGISARRAASIMDTFSCFAQGLLPYGAQLLIAAGIASEGVSGSISTAEIIPYLYYPMIMGACALLAIIIQWPRYNKK
ncbi:MAG: Na+/H+ antiporter NhaC family protein [Alistipes sp.]|nr:Na+/H+ antiporter NhaC family protein [Alistipes sp.]